MEGHLHVSKVQGHMFIIPSHANDLLTAGELRQVYPCRGWRLSSPHRHLTERHAHHPLVLAGHADPGGRWRSE